MPKTAKKVHIVDDCYMCQGTDEGQTRENEKTDEDVKNMAYSLQMKGMTDHLTLNLGNEDLNHGKPFEICNGSHRINALRLILDIANGVSESIDLGNEKIIDGTFNGEMFNGILDVFIDERVMLPAERLKVQLTANYNSKKPLAKDSIAAIQALMYADPTLTVKDISRELALSEKHVHTIFKTIKLPDNMRDALQNGDITLNNAAHLSKLKNKISDEDLEDMFEKGKTQVEKDFAIEVSNTLQNVSKPGKGKKKEEGFKPTVKYRKKQEAIDYMNRMQGLYEEVIIQDDAEHTDFISGQIDAARWFLGLDDESISAQEATYDINKVKRQETAEKRQANRDKQSHLDKFYDLIKSKMFSIESIPEVLQAEYREYAKAREQKEAELKTKE